MNIIIYMMRGHPSLYCLRNITIKQQIRKKPNSHLDIDDIFKIIGKRLIGGGGGMIPI